MRWNLNYTIVSHTLTTWDLKDRNDADHFSRKDPYGSHDLANIYPDDRNYFHVCWVGFIQHDSFTWVCSISSCARRLLHTVFYCGMIYQVYKITFTHTLIRCSLYGTALPTVLWRIGYVRRDSCVHCCPRGICTTSSIVYSLQRH